LAPSLDVVVHDEFVQALTVMSALIFGLSCSGVEDVGVFLESKSL
jgi:hypothetical protein